MAWRSGKGLSSTVFYFLFFIIIRQIIDSGTHVRVRLSIPSDEGNFAKISRIAFFVFFIPLVVVCVCNL
jgi:hypothetical protein